MFQGARKILFVGRDAKGVEQIRELLRNTAISDSQLENVSTYPAAITCFSRNDHDICVIDREDDGIKLIKEARRVGSNVPIIMITSDSADEVLSAIRSGAMDCLVREELDAASLEESICTVIQRAQHLERQAQNERCYLGLVENTTETIFTHDLEGNYTFINKAGEQMTGYSQNEILGLNLSDVIAEEYLDAVQQTILRMLNDHQPSFYETIIVTKDGQRIVAKISAHLLYREGIPIGVQGIAQTVPWQVLTPTVSSRKQHYETSSEN